MLLRLDGRRHWQAITLDDPIDRDGRRSVTGGNGARQCGNNASNETAQKQSCNNILQPDTGPVPHGTTPKPRSIRKKER